MTEICKNCNWTKDVHNSIVKCKKFEAVITKANHDSEYMKCKCGDKKKLHKLVRDGIKGVCCVIRGNLLPCPCKKFEPKNHNQGASSLGGGKRYPSSSKDNTSTLSDKIAHIYDAKKRKVPGEWLDIRDIKEFIKRLKDASYPTGHNKRKWIWIDEILKLAGDKLT